MKTLGGVETACKQNTFSKIKLLRAYIRLSIGKEIKDY